ncbi:Cdc6-like AAA superfamily ATPase [Paenibacillus sp. V4I3]|uniref:KAP family P-loop NTPase fold protein n=1 Tax=Paenibacillus sp. V4I3 TaxID=3042305 RepID=UPI00277F0212|nr:P-loop NTPase fold protein [Paenibacillus sp. V4I3]MDQ0876779.1 Cdc6-like AAA superfamily ATPase [Paenibacillus sp. V4I3]
METIYSNRPFDLNSSSDMFGTYFKSRTIKSILDVRMDYFKENNMIALYGTWGSGKTSVMRYLQSEIENYSVIFFEAWKYEYDSNLSLSLLEAIMDQIEKEKDILHTFIDETKSAARKLFSLGKNIILNTDISLPGAKISTSKAFSQTKEMYEKKSFYSEVQSFNNKFNRIIEKYYEITNKKLLIFIDDLDRCEPSNVLNLLSSIKHFFTDTNKIVYFSGIDKKAVSKAINIKYNNHITAEEYLEKIFDVTFHMPTTYELDKLIEDFLIKVNDFDKMSEKTGNLIKEFLGHINFNNPRKIKKIFNKYLFLCELNRVNKHKSNGLEYKLIPQNFSRHEPLQVIYTLYILILFEFEKEIFNEMFDYQSKMGKVKEEYSSENIQVKSNTQVGLVNLINEKVINIPYLKWNSESFDKLTRAGEHREIDFFIMLLYMLPLDVKKVSIPLLNTTSPEAIIKLIETFISGHITTANKIQYLFVTFTWDLLKEGLELQTEDIAFHKLFEMANLYL